MMKMANHKAAGVFNVANLNERRGVIEKRGSGWRRLMWRGISWLWLA